MSTSKPRSSAVSLLIVVSLSIEYVDISGVSTYGSIADNGISIFPCETTASIALPIESAIILSSPSA